MSKYNRTYHFDFSQGTTSDDKIATDSNNLIGQEIVITEKLDGENNCFTSEGVYARSHAEFTTSPWSLKVRQFHSIIRSDIPKDMFLFGEGMEAIHSIEYSELTSPFYLFGIRVNDTWIDWDLVEEWSYLLNIPTVPVLFKGKVKTYDELKKLVESLSKEESALGGDREGVVVRSSNSFLNDDFANNVQKWVRKNHVKTDEHWTKNWKPAKINYKWKYQ
jgi:hypothetical protein